MEANDVNNDKQNMAQLSIFEKIVEARKAFRKKGKTDYSTLTDLLNDFNEVLDKNGLFWQFIFAGDSTIGCRNSTIGCRIWDIHTSDYKDFFCFFRLHENDFFYLNEKYQKFQDSVSWCVIQIVMELSSDYMPKDICRMANLGYHY